MSGERNPYEDLLTLRERMNELFELTGAGAGSKRGWAPPTDIFETDTELVLSSELPGLEAAGIRAGIEAGVLVVEGERPRSPYESSSEPDAHAHTIERRRGTFTFRFPVNVPVDPSRAQARYEGGVLRIQLPKDEAAPTPPPDAVFALS